MPNSSGSLCRHDCLVNNNNIFASSLILKQIQSLEAPNETQAYDAVLASDLVDFLPEDDAERDRPWMRRRFTEVAEKKKSAEAELFSAQNSAALDAEQRKKAERLQRARLLSGHFTLVAADATPDLSVDSNDKAHIQRDEKSADCDGGSKKRHRCCTRRSRSRSLSNSCTRKRLRNSDEMREKCDFYGRLENRSSVSDIDDTWALRIGRE